MKFKQKGASITTWLIGSSLIVVLAVQLVHFVPPFLEFRSVSNILDELSIESGFGGWSKPYLLEKMDAKLHMNEITRVQHEDIHLTQEQGKQIVEVKYQVVIPVLGYLSGLWDFHHKVEVVAQ